ncbi:MAG TPA: aspartate kinase [Bacteroidales bacterium]|nr:aspartate kinase [Bacteroidales bacterium]
MKVYKFGGASVTDATGIINLTRIVSEEPDNLAVVVSAFGKTTNSLEQVLKYWLAGDDTYNRSLEEIFNSHQKVIRELFTDIAIMEGKLNISFASLKEYLLSEKRRDYDFVYDQVVSYGEIWSTMIVAEYLKLKFPDVEWLDIRENLLTDDRFRDANILWSESTKRIETNFDFKKNRIYVTQGFIGGTITGQTTTLGREGSDYTAAIIANILDAECVVFWKDVPGILNADPKWFPDAEPLDEISYKEAVEMTFSGAKVIHPKTIKPLHNKNISLYVRSFIEPAVKGTVIKADATLKKVIPVFIKKEDQILISILPKDFSFAMGDNLSMVFHSFMINGIKVNLVQASAVSINVCVDDERNKVDKLIDNLKEEYATVYNDKVEMLSIRHYTPKAIENITRGREILLEQRTRSTVRFVVRTA